MAAGISCTVVTSADDLVTGRNTSAARKVGVMYCRSEENPPGITSSGTFSV